uniref:L-Ala-D/L-amino acid epimerase isoform X1 n=1 Tax=Rhizophora mucronata TaxID=61149 RepID=A0A2P2K024_RHIMU
MVSDIAMSVTTKPERRSTGIVINFQYKVEQVRSKLYFYAYIKQVGGSRVDKYINWFQSSIVFRNLPEFDLIS